MLIEMEEFEGEDLIRQAVAPHLSGEELSYFSLFDRMDYLFWGRSENMPGLWIAGGITKAGFSVTGSGISKRTALLGTAGEVAETAVGATRSSHPDPSRIYGFAAHRHRQNAIRHARDELIERHIVESWWNGFDKAEIWPSDDASLTLERFGQWRNLNRPMVSFMLAHESDATVMVAASFDETGREFCFGAACRATPELALLAASRELAQSEFGLDLARMKQRILGDARMSPADWLSLSMAEVVGRDELISRCVASSPAHLAKRKLDIPSTISEFEIEVIDGWLHVVGAMSPVPKTDRGPHPGPFPEVTLYRVAG